MPVAGVVVLLAAIGAVIAIAQAANDDRGATTRDAPAAHAPGSDASTTTAIDAPVRHAPPAPTGGVAFDDPEGAYTMTIDPDWAGMSLGRAGTEVWSIGVAAGGFTPNVNVVTQAAPDLDLDGFVAVSVDDLDAVDAELVARTYVQGTDGAMLGAVRYAMTPPGAAGPLEFLAVFDVRNGTAVVATLTGTADGFDTLVGEVEPYLLTLRATR